MRDKKLTALIVDDEKEDRDILTYMLKEHKEITIIDQAESTESALFKFLELKPDIVFLDLVMPGKNGMELISLLKKQKLETNIVIVSAYRDMAIEAIKNEVYDFLLKPIGPRKLHRVIANIERRRSKVDNIHLNNLLGSFKQETKLRLSSTNSHILVDPNDILYCEAEGTYTHIHLENGNIELANTYLGKIEDFLIKNNNFFRISRRHLINLDKLWRANKADNSCILIANNEELKLYGSKKQIRELCKIDNPK
jgi:DNA-binding LytR/AlgR family response regulator